MKKSITNFFIESPEDASKFFICFQIFIGGIVVLLLDYGLFENRLNIISLILAGFLAYFYFKILHPAYQESKVGTVLEKSGFNESGSDNKLDPAEKKSSHLSETAQKYLKKGATESHKYIEYLRIRGNIITGAFGLVGFPILMLYIRLTCHFPEVSIVTFIVIFVFTFSFLINKKNQDFEEQAYNLANVWRNDKKTEASLHQAYGTKGWATNEQIIGAVGNNPGVWIGGAYTWLDRGHILTIGSNSAGKGSNFVVPCLLSPAFADSGSSFICLDPKGENAIITKRATIKHGFDVHILNPFAIPDLSNSRFNPFTYTSKDDDNVIEYCDMLAEMIIPIKSGNDSTAEHFDTQARSILSAYMLHLLDVKDLNECNFTTLFKWANFGGSQLDTLLAEMTVSESYRGILSSIISGFNETRLSGGEKEASGILSTIKKGLEPFKNFKLQDSTAVSDFDLREVAKKQMGIYVCIPQAEMDKNKVWLRLVMGCSIKLLQKHYNKDRKVVFIMDEFPTLGYMREFEQNAGLMAGYNVTFWVLLQLLPQIQALYPKMWETFVANASVKQFLGIGDVTTAEYISKLMPNDLITVRQGADGLREIQKKLMEPSEILSTPFIILFLSKLDRPTILDRLPYYEIEYLKNRADARPML